MIINGLMNKVNKGDMEQQVNTKLAEIRANVDKLIGELTRKIENDLNSLNDELSKKSNQDDIQYYRKELAFKLDKSEMESMR